MRCTGANDKILLRIPVFEQSVARGDRAVQGGKSLDPPVNFCWVDFHLPANPSCQSPNGRLIHWPDGSASDICLENIMTANFGNRGGSRRTTPAFKLQR